MWGLLKPNYPKKYKTKYVTGAIKKHPLEARQGHIKQVCKISGSNSKKRRGHWHLKEFGVLCLNQPVLESRL